MKKHRTACFLTSICFLWFLASGAAATSPGNSDSPLPDTDRWAAHGLVVSDSQYASDIGRDVMRAGGNAIDGAVATAFALSVTFPWSAPVGGGGFAVVHRVGFEPVTLDFREVAPARAHRDMYLDADGEVVPGRSLVTALASGVPGTVDGLLRLWQDHGSGALTLGDLLQPSIDLARDGFAVGPGLARQLQSKRDYLSRDSASREIFVKETPWRPGDLLVQADLANTLEKIVQRGRAGFYSGPTAQAIVEKMEREEGLIDASDLVNYSSVYRIPVRSTFRDYEIVSMGPPSSGGILICQMLAMFDSLESADWEWNSADYVHHLTELQRRVYADRSVHLGDPEFWDVPTDGLLSDSYLRDRLSTLDPERATASADVQAGDFAVSAVPANETTHLSVVDRLGNAVSMTVTLNAGFGSGRVIDGTGVLLNNEMDDFSARPGTPNLYGLIGNEANAIAPGKRMLSSMSPTIVLQDGRPALVLGSPGGSRIINAVLQVSLNRLHFGMSIADAVAAPRTHSQWVPDKLFYEERSLAPETRARLTEMGHELESFGAVGRVNAIAREQGLWWPATDPRGDGGAAGY